MTFDEELIAVGIGVDEVGAAFDGVAGQLWSEVDAAMADLWETSDERASAELEFSGATLFDSPPSSRDGVVRISLDIEADMAGEALSGLVDAPVVASRRMGDQWCRLMLFEAGRARGWLFWAAETWGERFEGESEPALAAAARANGGWVGDPSPFGAVLAPEYRVGDLRRLLDGEFDDAIIFSDEFFRLCGAPPRV